MTRGQARAARTALLGALLVTGMAPVLVAQGQERMPVPTQALPGDRVQQATPASRPAAAGDEFTYRTRAGDTLIGIATRLLREPRRWPQLQARNRIADPRRMPRGSAVRIPYDWLRLAPQSATVVERVGGVTVDGRGLAVGDVLQGGAAIETAADGSATLELVDGSVLVLKPASRLRLERLQRVEGAAADEAVLELERGKVETQVKPRGDMGRFEIRTPAAVSAVRGTEFRAGYAADAARGSTETLGGAVAVSGAGTAVSVGAGFGTSAEAGKPPRAPVPLLPAPRLDALPTLNDGAALRWSFAPVPGAVAYRHQLARDAEFRALVAESVTPEPAGAVAALADGRYWLRARAIDAGGIEGFDATLALEQRRRLDAPVAIAPIGGAKRIGAATRFEWAAVEGASGYRFQLARDATFGEMLAERSVTLGQRAAPVAVELAQLAAGSYAWRVMAIGTDGRDGHWGAAQAFVQKPPAATIETLTAGAPAQASAQSSSGAEADASRGSSAFRWPQTEPGQRYDWQLARRADFTRLERQGSSATPTLTLADLPPGRHWLRVRAIDADGFVSPYGPARAFDVPYPRWLPYVTLAILLIPIL